MTSFTNPFYNDGITKPLFAEAVRSPQVFRWRAETHCLQCTRPMTLEYDGIYACYRIGHELIGVLCDACLAPEGRERLEAKRQRVRQDA